jgi:amino acid transporter
VGTIKIEEENGTTVVHRTIDYAPPTSWRTWLIGRPLATADAPHQTIRKIVGLAVFASDALSSTAYATEEMLVVLAVAGAAAFGYALPISIAIVVLLAIVTLSYEQTIHAYPGGGGAYIVARDNLGEVPAQTAGASLLTDYVLTVAVSISPGVAQLLGYIEEVAAQRQPNETITIVVPQFVPRRWWHNVLHTQTALVLGLALLLKPGIVITDVPYQVE